MLRRAGYRLAGNARGKLRRVAGAYRSFISSLTERAQSDLRSLGVVRKLQPGATIALEGDTGDRVWLVESGLVKASSMRVDGRDSILALRGPGDLLGELSAIDGLPRSATLTTVTSTELRSFSRAGFLAFVAAEPSAASALLQQLVVRLRDADEQRVSHGGDDVPTRLCHCVLDLADRHGRSVNDGAVEIDLPLTQIDLASLVGASRDAVARALQNWRDANLIVTGRRSVVLLDPAKLAGRYRSALV